ASAIQDDAYVADLHYAISFLLRGIPAEIVGQTRAPAGHDCDAQHGVGEIDVLVGRDLTNLLQCSIGDENVFHRTTRRIRRIAFGMLMLDAPAGFARTGGWTRRFVAQSAPLSEAFSCPVRTLDEGAIRRGTKASRILL